MNLTGRPYNQQYKSTINTADVTKTLHIYTKMLFPCTCIWDEVNATDTVALTHVVKATDTINPD